jgi:hypothetical protein
VSSLNDVSALRELAVPMPMPGPGRALRTHGLVRWVCTKNPFYVLSALLFLMGLEISFGAQVRDEQTRALVIGMSGYTLLLAVPACLLVRFGGVWEDVRTVLLLVVLMFLATSVTFDDTLARSPGLGIACYLGGLLFAVGVSEGMLRAMRLRLPGWFRTAYYLFLGLFFLYPVALVPLLDQPRSEALEWALFGFSPLAGLVALSLLPAIRRGPDYLRDNGSPWRWPLYPWSLFVFLGFGVAARSFLLCWSMQHVERSDPEQFIFGPYFLVPFLLAVAFLLLELGLAVKSRGVLRVALLLPLGLIVLASGGDRSDDLYQGFLALFSERLGGTPLYLTLLAAAGFSTYAWLRRVPRADVVLTVVLAILACAGSGIRSLHDLGQPRPWPILAIAALQLGQGIWRRDAYRCLVGSGSLIAAVMIGQDLPLRGPIAFHLILAAVLALGAAFDDGFARMLRHTAAALGLLASLLVLFEPWPWDRSGLAPPWLLTAYPLLMAALLASYGRVLRHPGSNLAAGLALACWFAAHGWRTYTTLRQMIGGLDFIATALALLALAELISLAKAGLLPVRFARRVPKVADPLE